MIRFAQVQGSARSPYIVSISDESGGTWACSCPAWTRTVPREDCKHIMRVRLLVERALAQNKKIADDPKVTLLVSGAGWMARRRSSEPARRATESPRPTLRPSGPPVPAFAPTPAPPLPPAPRSTVSVPVPAPVPIPGATTPAPTRVTTLGEIKEGDDEATRRFKLLEID
jgi:hypothetical protein